MGNIKTKREVAESNVLVVCGKRAKISSIRQIFISKMIGMDKYESRGTYKIKYVDDNTLTYVDFAATDAKKEKYDVIIGYDGVSFDIIKAEGHEEMNTVYNMPEELEKIGSGMFIGVDLGEGEEKTDIIYAGLKPIQDVKITGITEVGTPDGDSIITGITTKPETEA